MIGPRPRAWLRIGAVGLLAWCLLQWPVTTRQGIDTQVRSHTISLYAKGLAFLYRDSQYRVLAKQITRGLETDREKALVVLRWTNERIRPVPGGLPVMDDHVLNIMIRGYGTDDQMADVFTTLCTYAGVAAFWQIAKSPQSTRVIVLSFARMEGRWVLLDVANGRLFKNAKGEMADLSELKSDPALLGASGEQLWHPGRSYERHLPHLKGPDPPPILRAHKQMPGPRLLYEARRAFRLER